MTTYEDKIAMVGWQAGQEVSEYTVSYSTNRCLGHVEFLDTGVWSNGEVRKRKQASTTEFSSKAL